jgi:hypothetical protein
VIDMRRATVVLIAVSLIACARDRTVPQPAAGDELETPPQHDAGRLDTSVFADAPNAAADGGVSPDDVRPDGEPTRDTGLDDVILLTQGPPPDAVADTAAPDVLTLVDAALPGIGDAPTP